ncbi:unnamed protein product [Ranitomeya imitator]|uniref:Uncharacterized protein n=1 Tax=Ranitomeya imitator TaxID=111125 RepID=A0ABN9MKH1_9NEOB|nr:unnamed protein product [Ranitomeya imitator]
MAAHPSHNAPGELYPEVAFFCTWRAVPGSSVTGSTWWLRRRQSRLWEHHGEAQHGAAGAHTQSPPAAGLLETARKLQEESGEHFNSHKKTLEKMLKQWNKKDKKKREKNDASRKKTSQQEPISAEASGDKGDVGGKSTRILLSFTHAKEAKKAVLVTQDKKVPVKRTVKRKIVDPEAMDATKKPASKAKAAPRSRKLATQSKPSATEIPAVSAQGIDDPDGGVEKMASPVTARTQLRRLTESGAGAGPSDHRGRTVLRESQGAIKRTLPSSPIHARASASASSSSCSPEGRSVHDSEYESEESLTQDSSLGQETLDSLIEAVNKTLMVDEESVSTQEHVMCF